jgi:hypothetical protein
MPKFSDAAEQAQDDGPDAQVEPGSWEPSEADDTADAEAAGEPEPEAKPSAEPERPPKPEHEPQPSPGSDAGSGADAPRRGRYVRSDAIKAAVRGREAEVVRAVGIPWRGGTDHIHCKYPSHADKHPSWRLDENGTVFCSAGCPRGSRPHSIFDAVSFMEGLDFEAAKIRVAQIIGRHDLIVDPAAAQGVTVEQLAEEKKLAVKSLHKVGMFNLRSGHNHDGREIGIPYWDIGEGPRVKARWLRRRIALTDKDRFRWRKGDVAKHGKAPLYGAWNLVGDKPQQMLLVEGETDCVTLWINGFPALGIPGSPGGWNEERHAPMLDGIAQIVVVIEPDGGGAELLERLATSSVVPRLHVLRMPANVKDPNALWCQNPDCAAFQAAFAPMLDAAEPFDREKHAPKASQHVDADSADFVSSERREQLYGLEGALVPLRGLPIIEYAGGRLADATAEAEQILAERDQDLFQRGDSLVRLARESKFVISGERKTTGPRLLLVQHMNMRMRFNQARRLPEMEREAQGIRIDQRTG